MGSYIFYSVIIHGHSGSPDAMLICRQKFRSL